MTNVKITKCDDKLEDKVKAGEGDAIRWHNMTDRGVHIILPDIFDDGTVYLFVEAKGKSKILCVSEDVTPGDYDYHWTCETKSYRDDKFKPLSARKGTINVEAPGPPPADPS